MAQDRGLPSQADRSWRDTLWRHAEECFDAASGSRSAPALADEDRQGVEAALGPLADEAVRIVEDYAVGAATRSGNSPTTPPESRSSFSRLLGLVLDGFEPETPRDANEPPRPGIIQSELWQLLHMVRESAELSYSREIDIVELDRRILLLINQEGPQVPADIALATGVDKAQISRSVKRLLELRMIEREQIRAPVRLSRKGQAVGDRLRKMANLRNHELSFDIGDKELEEFFGVVDKLLNRAIVLYEQERDHSAEPDAEGATKYARPPEERSPEGRIVMNRRQIVAPLLTLSAYFGRSGSLVFKRLTKLSRFEAWVLNEIGMNPPIAWADLVNRINRDHSQAGRTVTGLIKKGLVEREGKSGRRHGRFSPTPQGWELYERIQQASRERSTFLLAPLSPLEREAFLATFAKIRRNAVAQLQRERAFAEFD